MKQEIVDGQWVPHWNMYYIVDEDKENIIEQPIHWSLSTDVYNEDGYTNMLFHGVSIYPTKEEAMEKLNKKKEIEQNHGKK